MRSARFEQADPMIAEVRARHLAEVRKRSNQTGDSSTEE
jgi:hypothetical protein